MLLFKRVGVGVLFANLRVLVCKSKIATTKKKLLDVLGNTGDSF